ncbi:MAG: hypothetical protein DRP45_01140 [Candidatus Zixiibacteriota bacterium]|nr:MAG: hypothetical protein DRP45_01140 [candidate division Zixibacteria bacterium]
MKKIIILSLILILVMSLSSFATKTRVKVLGDNNGILVDDYNMFRFPGRTFNYPNIAVADFMYYEEYYYDRVGSDPSPNVDGHEFYNFGINWQFGEDNPFVVGTYISSLPAELPEGYMGEWLADYDYDYIDPNRRIDLFFGRQLGSNNFGFHFDYTCGGWEEDDSHTYPDTVTTQQEKESFTQYNFALGLTEGTTGQWDVALSLGFGSWTDEDNQGNKITEPNGYSDFTLEGRYFWVRSPKITLVPHAGFAIGKRGTKEYDHYYDPESYDDGISTLDFEMQQSLFAFDGGCGMHYQPGPNLLAVMDFGIQYVKIKEEANYSDTIMVLRSPDSWERNYKVFTLPYLKFGLEADVFSWMDVRFGATSYWNVESWESDYVDAEDEESWTYKDTYKWADNCTYLGFCFHWGRLYVDTYADPELFLNGFDFITSEGTSQMSWEISALYEMF